MANLKAQGAGIFLSDDASPQVYTEIAQTVSVAGPDGTAAEIDVTALNSTAKEFIMGLPDEGSVTLEVVHDPSNTQHEALRAARVAQSLKNFQIKLTDSPQTTYSFSAYVMSFSMSMSTDDAIRASYTLRISGAVTKS